EKQAMPYEDNVLDLDPTVKDSLGFPVIRITADHKDNEKKLGAFIQDKMAQWFMEAGAKSRSSAGRWAPWARRPTPMAAPAWATTARPTWSTALVSHTRCRTSVSSAARGWALTARTTPHGPRRRWPGARPSISARTGRRSRIDEALSHRLDRGRLRPLHPRGRWNAITEPTRRRMGCQENPSPASLAAARAPRAAMVWL